MKKISVILMVVALVLGMTQCRKRNELLTQNNQGIFVTLRVTNDAKHTIILDDPENPNNVGKVSFSPGDFIWVVNGNQVSGALGYNGSVFQGYIDSDPTGLWGGITLDEDDYLWFCYSTNMSPETYVEGYDDKESGLPGIPYFLLNIKDQTQKLPVISFGRTEHKYGYYVENGGLDALECELKNKCSLAKFTLGTATSDVVTLVNVCNTTRFDINKNTLVDATPVPEKKGLIRLYNPAGNTASDVRWGILLSVDEAVKADVVIGNTLYKDAVTIPALEDNTLICDNPLSITTGTGISLGNSAFYNPQTQGWFEVAKGNLQYDKSTNLYSFMTNQWSTVETSNMNVGNNYANQDIVSLFGWDAWGKTCTLPYNTSTIYTQYTWLNDFNENLEIDGKTGWRTITSEEAKYIFEERDNPNMESYYSATVNGVHGFIILSDVFNGTVPSGAEPDMNGWSNWVVSSAADWATLQNAGAVFFPAAGYRHSTDVFNVDAKGKYWTNGEEAESDPNMTFRPYLIDFDEKYLDVYAGWRSDYGFSVRLIRDIE